MNIKNRDSVILIVGQLLIVMTIGVNYWLFSKKKSGAIKIRDMKREKKLI